MTISAYAALFIALKASLCHAAHQMKRGGNGMVKYHKRKTMSASSSAKINSEKNGVAK